MSRRAGKLAAVTAAVTTLCATAALTVACGLVGGDGTRDGEVTPARDLSPTPATPPEEALRLWVERRLNQGFVADCDEARRPDDVGKQCARLRGERDGLLAYELGPTFGEPTRLMILQAIGGSWTIAYLEERDPDLAPVPGIPWPLETGATVVVVGTSRCLRVREEPGLQAREVDCLENGTVVTTGAGPVERDGLEWWRLEGYGWSAGRWLRYPEEAPAHRKATPTA